MHRSAALLAVSILAASGARAVHAGDAAPPVQLVPCTEDRDWQCGTLEVPLDRANARGEKISVAFYVLPRPDSSESALEPLFATPGGPGASVWATRSLFERRELRKRRDIVLVDPRGAGHSAAIDCADLQDGWNGIAALKRAIALCGRQLGQAADRYGAGDIALDVDDLRLALGYQRIAWYASSYGSVALQAYAARFPAYLRALVVDAGLSATDPSFGWPWGTPLPKALERVGVLKCRRLPSCTGDVRYAMSVIARKIRTRPVTETVSGRTRVVVGEPEIIEILTSAGDDGGALGPKELFALERAVSNRDAKRLRDLAKEHPLWPGTQGDPTRFSRGAYFAAVCNDLDFVWKRTDSRAAREQRYAAALATVPGSAFAPFSVSGWTAYRWPDACAAWPATRRLFPAVPPGESPKTLPVLILSGDEDTVVPTELTKGLLRFYQGASVVKVAGAGHVTLASRPECVGPIVARFFEKRDPGDLSCTKSP